MCFEDFKKICYVVFFNGVVFSGNNGKGLIDYLRLRSCIGLCICCV